jgi:hypothetical protein
VAVAVGGHPRPVVHRLERGQERAVEVERLLPESRHGPARERDVADVRVDEVEMTGVVERHVTLVAEVVLLERQRREAGKVVEGLAAVARRPRPGHAARIGRRVLVRAEHELPVLLVRRGEDVAEVVDVDGRLVAEAEVRRHLHRWAERDALRGRPADADH